MTYLELCQKLRQECGISGSGPTAVTGQVGQLKRVVEWIADAWTEIQSHRSDWDFMWTEFSFNTAAATRDYTATAAGLTDFDQWDTDTFLIYKNATGTSDQNDLEFLEYQFWRQKYRVRMDERADDRPLLVTALPNKSLRFEPRPDDIYTVEGIYKRGTQTLAADDDELTGFPEKFHMMVVWKAMEYFAFFDDAPEVLTQSQEMLNIWWPILEREQLPSIIIGAESIGF